MRYCVQGKAQYFPFIVYTYDSNTLWYVKRIISSLVVSKNYPVANTKQSNYISYFCLYRALLSTYCLNSVQHNAHIYAVKLYSDMS